LVDSYFASFRALRGIAAAVRRMCYDGGRSVSLRRVKSILHRKWPERLAPALGKPPIGVVFTIFRRFFRQKPTQTVFHRLLPKKIFAEARPVTAKPTKMPENQPRNPENGALRGSSAYFVEMDDRQVCSTRFSVLPHKAGFLLRRIYKSLNYKRVGQAYEDPRNMQKNHYLGRYTYKVAIGDHRILDVSNGKVTFTWRDRSDGRSGTATSTQKRPLNTP